MVVVKLMGGLGNQMFQYAAGRMLSNKYQVPLKVDERFLLDRSPRENFTYRNPELHHFNIVAESLTPEQSRLYNRKVGLLSFVEKKILNKNNYVHFRESSFRYDQAFIKQPANTYLEGFWQSEKYFESIRTLLLNEFTGKNAPCELNTNLLNQISSQNAVSVHIRRGDYVANKVIGDYPGICNTLVIYFFSDEIEWVKSAFSQIQQEAVFVAHNQGDKSFEDLRLMSACKHNIIANSSFSWWGAWLNANPQKTVIAPEKWFSNPAIDSSDLIPDTWLKLG